MSAYTMLLQDSYERNDYRIAALRHEDMRDIKVWRNEQIDVLRQNKILTDEDQTRYYEKVVLPSMGMDRPPLILFGYSKHGRLIGYGGLTNIDWSSLRAEVSFLVSTERITDDNGYESDFRHFLRLLKRIAFEELQFNRLFTETYDIRPKHVAILEAEGFGYEGRMKQHVQIGGRFVDSLLHGCLKEHYDVERAKDIR